MLHDVVLVKPGERITMDGEVIAGTSAVNEAPITGESRPVVKSPGDTVYGGTLNGFGALDIEVTHLFRDTTLARFIHWVEEARSHRARAQLFIDRFARIYTPIVVCIAIGIAILPPLFEALHSIVSHAPIQLTSAHLSIARALTVLLISCPCALVISTPVAIVTAIGNASRTGVLVKGGACLEAAASLKAVLYDKTGHSPPGTAELNG